MTSNDRKLHWETVYSGRAPESFSWHQDDPRLSLSMIQEVAPDCTSAIIDVGGGASRLVDHLLASGYSDVSVLDISGAAIAAAKQRLGESADSVAWLETDVTAFMPTRRYHVWHDRAAFHFLTDTEDRRRYVASLNQALSPEGHAIIATFALQGPTKCSGLEVARYDAAGIEAELGPGFVLVDFAESLHVTPTGTEQAFTIFRFRRRRA